jgi:hypothetical protein
MERALYFCFFRKRSENKYQQKRLYHHTEIIFKIKKTVSGEIYHFNQETFRFYHKDSAKGREDTLYFQISSVKVKPDTSGVGGLNLKSGDIIGLEKSYAEFLSLIYKEEK